MITESPIRENYSPTTKPGCKKCGGQMAKGVAMAQTYTGRTPNAPKDHVFTMSPGGPGQLIECLKCQRCGWSVTGGGK